MRKIFLFSKDSSFGIESTFDRKCHNMAEYLITIIVTATVNHINHFHSKCIIFLIPIECVFSFIFRFSLFFFFAKIIIFFFLFCFLILKENERKYITM